MPHLSRVLGSSRKVAELSAAIEAAKQTPGPSPFQVYTPPELPPEPVESDPKRRAALEVVRKLRGIANDITKRCERAIERKKSLRKRREAEEYLRDWLLTTLTMKPWWSPPHLSEVAGRMAAPMSALPSLAEATVASYTVDARRSLPETALLRVLYRRIESLPLRTYAYLGDAAMVQHLRYETDGATLMTDSSLLSATNAVGPPGWQEWCDLASDLTEMTQRYLALHRENNMLEELHFHSVDTAGKQLDAYAEVYDVCVEICREAGVQPSRWPPLPSAMESYFDTEMDTVAQKTWLYSPHLP